MEARPTTSRRTATFAALSALALTAGPLHTARGQEPATAAPRAPSRSSPQGSRAAAGAPARVAPKPGQRVLFDRVVGIVGNKVILESAIQRELGARVAGYRAAGNERLPIDLVLRWRREILRNRARAEFLAQGARTLPSSTRERMEAFEQQYLEQYEQDQIRKHGSFGKFVEELGVLGETWQSVREEEQTRFLAWIAQQQALSRRARDRRALLVTPMEMLAWYRAHEDHYRRPASADVEVLTVADGPDALERAGRIARAWRAGRPRAELEQEFGATTLDPFLGVRDDPADPRAKRIKKFAARAREGEISEPERVGRSWWILRLAKRHPEQVRPFSDPDVQEEILRILATEKENELKMRFAMRSKQRLYYDIPELPDLRAAGR